MAEFYLVSVGNLLSSYISYCQKSAGKMYELNMGTVDTNLPRYSASKFCWRTVNILPNGVVLSPSNSRLGMIVSVPMPRGSRITRGVFDRTSPCRVRQSATRVNGAVERKAKTRAGRRIIASRVCPPCSCGVHGKKCTSEREREKNVHAHAREEKSGIYFSGTERGTTPAGENNKREKSCREGEDREDANVGSIEAKVMMREI